MDIKEYRNSLIQALSKKGVLGVDIAEIFNMTKQNISFILKEKSEITMGFIDFDGDLTRIDPIFCPKCGFNYVHFGKSQEIECDFRGGCIKIPMWCENHDAYDLIIAHHKGNSYMFWDNMRPDLEAIALEEKLNDQTPAS